MEPAVGYWEQLFWRLKAKGFEVGLVSSLKVRHSKDIMDNSPLKSDQKVAGIIARLVKEGNVPDFRMVCPDRQEVKTLLYTASAL